MGIGRSGLLSALLDLVFPPRCAGCGGRGVWLCPVCAAALPAPTPPLCRFCGRPTGGTERCADCWPRRPATDAVLSAYFFEGPLRTLIHRFKYNRARYLAKPLAGLMLEKVEALPHVEVVVPVPLHPSRLRQRGYNQAALLAQELGRSLAVPVVDDCLQRTRDTPAQIGLPAIQRKRNVRGAFRCVDGRLAGQRVLLVDDVCTTGATLEASAQALRRGGAATIAGLTLARAR